RRDQSATGGGQEGSAGTRGVGASRYGRLLAYVYVGDQMVNAELVRRGYAQVMTIPPNVRHQELFLKLQREAREQKRGLWEEPSEVPTPSPQPSRAQADRQSSGERPGAPPENVWTY